MTLKRLLALTFAASVLAPSAAFGQSDAPGDSYLRPILLNDGDFSRPQPIRTGQVPGFQIDTTLYGTQPDVFNPPGSGGPAEPTQCGSTVYGKTAWSVFYADRYGRADVKAAGGFDEVIAILPFNDPATDATPQVANGLCVDRIAGINEDFGNDPPSVEPGWYAIQMGGASGGGGVLQGTLEFLPPSRLTGDAVLSWNGRGNGVAASVKATAPKGSTIAFKCVNVGCGSLPRAQTIKKVTGRSLSKPIGDVTPRVASSRELREVSKSDPVAVAARSFFSNKFLKNGVRLEVRITAPGYIGNYFSWDVKGGKVGTKTRRCMNPNSTRPARRCSG
jgi:hypothetical protein